MPRKTKTKGARRKEGNGWRRRDLIATRSSNKGTAGTTSRRQRAHQAQPLMTGVAEELTGREDGLDKGNKVNDDY